MDEIILLLFFPVAFKGVMVALEDKNLRMMCLLFLIYIFLGLVSSVFSGIPILAVLYQLIDSIKFPIVLMVFLGLNFESAEKAKITYFIKFILVLSLFLTVFKYIDISAYRSVFSGSLKGIINSQGSFIYNTEGAFWHASQVAFFASTAFVYFYFGKSERYRVHWLSLSFLLLILAIQRQELFSLLVSLFFCWLFFEPLKSKKNKFVMGACVITVISFFMLLNLSTITNYLSVEISNLGLDNVEYSEAARVVLLRDSFFIASDYFPLGSGFGSFGGLGAFLANRDLYEDLFYNDYYFYRENMFLLDVGWSQVVAETGWIGFALYLCAIYNLLTYLKKQVAIGGDAGLDSRIVFCILLMFTINSITSSSLTSIFFLLLAFFWISLVKKEKA